jgi:predicted DNA-binding transcriptional regulator YafY
MSSFCHRLGVTRIDRLYAIREELRRRGPQGITAPQLAAVFEVSERTIKRDISALQASGFPLWARTGRIGGYVVAAEATLPPVNLTPEEILGLAVLASTSDDDLPYRAAARAALSKVLAVATPDVRARAERVAGRVWINEGDKPQPSISAALRTAIDNALSERRVLHLQYRDAAGTDSDRLVDPQMLARIGHAWYLVAWCRTRDALRWFRFDRITGARLTSHRATDVPVEHIGPPPPGASPVATQL